MKCKDEMRRIAWLLILIGLFTGCNKFDRSKIKMPKFDFVTSENVHSIAYVDAQHLWISGNYGVICFSADGGKTWEKQQSGIPEALLGTIRFVNEKEGWAAGVGGTMIHTADGGKTWEKQQSGTGKDLLDLFFLDSQYGWAVGELGTIIHTTDGGKTWSQQMEEADTIYNSVYFIDNKIGWIVGEFGTILHTQDGGALWQPQECRDLGGGQENSDWEKPKPALYGISFADKDRAFITGMDGVILRSTDGGTTWKKVNSGTDKPIYSVVVRGAKGWGVGNKGLYLTSNDGGESWTEDSTAVKTKFWLREVSFVDDKNGLIVGARGTIVTTSDGGSIWKIISGFRYDMEEFGLADF